MKIWENGSDFHYISGYAGTSLTPWNHTAVFYYSGRQALLALLQKLRSEKNVGNIWLPAYYCGQVIEFLPEFSFHYYDCDPINELHLPTDKINSNDSVILNCFFGVNLPNRIEINDLQSSGVVIIEDHSQDPYSPLSMTSQANYCFASLRKTLPLPDGGVLWSPVNAVLPENPATVPPVSIKRVAAMLAKKAYLNSEWSDKSIFREWYLETEEEFDIHALTQISNYSRAALHNFDVKRWRETRRSNYTKFYESLLDKARMPFNTENPTPMGIILLESSTLRRDELKRDLISQSVFPAILWPVPREVPEKDSKKAKEFASRCLFLHCDGRYNNADMRRIADMVNDFKF